MRELGPFALFLRSMESPWDDQPGSTNTIREQEWSKLSSEFTNAGYRTGIAAGKDSALQEGFDQGYAAAGVPLGRRLGLMRGILSAILASIAESSSSGDAEIAAEAQEIGSRLSRIRCSDVMPPDLEAEEHARLHGEEDGDAGQTGSGAHEMDVLEMIERMNTGSERANDGQRSGPPDRKPTAEELTVLKTALDRLVERLGLKIYAP